MNRYLILLLLAATVFGSCGGDGKKDGERVMFRYNQSSGISSLDPAFARDQANIWAINSIYNGLLQLDSKLNLQPALAKSWEVSEDGLTYTFHLRTDVHFHDHEVFPEGKGRRFVADDVLFTFSRLMDKATAAPGAWVFNGKVDAGNAFAAPNDSTFVLKLARPFRPMLSLLTLQYTYIVPHEVVDNYGRDFRINPVGTGPFRFVFWKEDNQLILERNPNYWEKKDGEQLPYLDGIKVFFIQSRESEYLKFRQGELDFISGIDATTANELLTDDGKLKPDFEQEMTLFKTPYLNLEYLGFMLDPELVTPESEPLLNKKVRLAINYAIDRAEMLRYLRNGIGRPANAGVIPYGLPSFDTMEVRGYAYQPDHSRRLLAEVGYPEGKGLQPITLYTNSGYLDLTEFIKKQLEAVGFKVNLENVPPQFQRELMTKGDAAFFRASWIADYPDGESYLSLFYSGNPAPPNYTRFNNAVYDSLYLLSLNESDQARRFGLYREMDMLILEEAPVVPLFYDEVVRFVRKDVKGLEPNGMNLLDLKQVKIEQ